MSIQFNAKQTTLKIMLKLQFLIGKKYNEEWSTVKKFNFSKLQFFKCNFTVISLHIFAVQVYVIDRFYCLIHDKYIIDLGPTILDFETKKTNKLF